VFQASELELLNMSGLYAENIQNAHINKYGQMVYGAGASNASSLNQNPSWASLPPSHRTATNNQKVASSTSTARHSTKKHQPSDDNQVATSDGQYQ